MFEYKQDSKRDKGSKSSSGGKGKGGGAKPTDRSQSGGKPSEKKDKGREKDKSTDGKAKKGRFLCGGPHWARECPQRQKLNALIASSSGESSGDEAHIGKAKVNGQVSKALIDTGATNNFIAVQEDTRMGIRFVKKVGSLKTVNSKPVPICGVASKGWNDDYCKRPRGLDHPDYSRKSGSQDDLCHAAE
uniref:Uncharacterized protein n=1 Tax=Chenopodium quinoa TaxID=63459 RepID=A0A803MP81_CHEQI